MEFVEDLGGYGGVEKRKPRFFDRLARGHAASPQLLEARHAHAGERVEGAEQHVARGHVRDRALNLPSEAGYFTV